MKPVNARLPVSRQALETDAILDLSALGGCALVVPEDRRAQDASFVVEAHEAVHLAREPDGGRVAPGGTGRPGSRATSPRDPAPTSPAAAPRGRSPPRQRPRPRRPVRSRAL